MHPSPEVHQEADHGLLRETFDRLERLRCGWDRVLPSFLSLEDSVFHERSKEIAVGHKGFRTYGMFAVQLCDVGAEFIALASCSTSLDIAARIAPLGDKSFQMRYAIGHNGRTQRVCLKQQVKAGRSKTRIPDVIRTLSHGIHV
jgi:hypothetical protein